MPTLPTTLLCWMILVVESVSFIKGALYLRPIFTLGQLVSALVSMTQTTSSLQEQSPISKL